MVQQIQLPSILVVEDTSNWTNLLKLMLQIRHYLVEVAENGQEALHMLQQKTYDAVVTDIQMPKMDGYETIEQMRKLGYRNPIIGFSVLLPEDTERELMELGMSAYVCKVEAFDKLIECLSRFRLAPPTDKPDFSFIRR